MNHLFTTFFDAGEHRETLILKKLRFYVLLGIKFPSEVRVTLEEFTPQDVLLSLWAGGLWVQHGSDPQT